MPFLKRTIWMPVGKAIDLIDDTREVRGVAQSPTSKMGLHTLDFAMSASTVARFFLKKIHYNSRFFKSPTAVDATSGRLDQPSSVMLPRTLNRVRLSQRDF